MSKTLMHSYEVQNVESTFRLDSIESNQGAPSPTHAGTYFPCYFDYLFVKI